MSKCSAFLFLIFGTLFLIAQESDLDTTDLFEMSLDDLMSMEITTGSKTAVSREEIPAVVSVITRDEIQRFGLRHLEDLLNLIPGFTTGRTNQITASALNLSVRGSTTFFAENVLVLRDGQRINDPNSGGGFTYLSRILLEDVERVEVIRGPGSALYGANAFVGVINLITDPSSYEQATTANLEVGDLEGQEASLRHVAPIKDGGFALTAQYQHYFDDFTEYPDVTQIIVPGVLEIPFTDRFGREESEVLDVSARLKYKGLVLSAQVQTLAMDNVSGVGLPRSGVFVDVLGVPHEGADGRKFDLDSDIDVLNLGAVYNRELNEKTQIQLALTYTKYKSDSEFGSPIQYAHLLSQPIVLDAVDQVAGFTVVTETETLNLDAYLEWAPRDGHQLIAGVNSQQDEAFEDTLVSTASSGQFPGLADLFLDPPVVIPSVPSSEREITALYSQYSVRFNEGFTATAGLRRDDYDDVGATTNPRLAFVYQTKTGYTWKLLYGTAFRAPNFQESKRFLPTFFAINPNIEPEENETVEFQVVYNNGSGLSFSTNFYQYTTDNVIRLTSTNNLDFPFEQVYINSGEREASGFESEVIWQSGPVSLFANTAVVLDSEETNLGLTQDVQGIPKFALNAGVTRRFGETWTLSGSLYHRADFVTLTHPTFAPLDLDDFTVIDLNLIWNVRPDLAVNLLLHNILDETKVTTESRTFQPSGVHHDERQILLGLRWQP